MEIEAKFAIKDAQTYQDLRNQKQIAQLTLGESVAIDVHDIYLDTADQRILRAGYACRQRESAGSITITLKSTVATQDAIHRREEMEMVLPEAMPFSDWPDGGIKQRVLHIARKAPLIPLFSLAQHREIRPVWHKRRLVAEFSLDVVTLHHPNEPQYREVEVELRDDGTEDDLAAIVAHLAAMPGLTPEKHSKFERGLDLINDPRPMPQSPGITPNDTIAEAARKTLHFHFRRMVANEEGTYQGEDIEALHDMRVATRRMRTAYRVFGNGWDVDTKKPHRKRLKRAGRILGAVRDLDVFRENVEKYLDSFSKKEKPDLSLLYAAWNAEYGHARTAMRSYLDSRAYTRFRDQLGAYLACPWSSDAPCVRDVVPDMIAACLADFYAYKARLDTPEADLTDYHQLRIMTKYLRYTLEYFHEVLGPEHKGAIDRLKALQAHLGALQDAVVASEQLHTISELGTWSTTVETALLWNSISSDAVAGVAGYLEFQQSEIRRLMDTFPKVWAYYESADFIQLISNAVAALTSTNPHS